MTESVNYEQKRLQAPSTKFSEQRKALEKRKSFRLLITYMCRLSVKSHTG